MLNVYKALWGMTGTLETMLAQIAEAGYQGVECPPPAEDQRATFRRLLEQHKLGYIGMLFTGGATWQEHAASFETQFKTCRDLGAAQITAHSARDGWDFDTQCRFYHKVVEFEAQQTVPVGHETHRGRAMFTPWTTAALLQKFPTLRITADFSHWVCVCESLLDDQAAHLQLAFARTIHIHARVGYEEGPQVPEPRAPEYARHLERHEQWWDAILAQRQAQGHRVTTLTPEFGPPGYLHTLPYTQQPVADLWDVCLHMGRRQRQRMS